MYRKKMPDNQGMIFVYDNETVLHFWMKNTYIPLAIAFVDSGGMLLEIKHMKPHDRTVVSSSKPAKYAIEANEGWFKKNRVKPGIKLRFEKK